MARRWVIGWERIYGTYQAMPLIPLLRQLGSWLLRTPRSKIHLITPPVQSFPIISFTDSSPASLT